MTGSPPGRARPMVVRQVTTIQDVAQAADVSRQTVSNVLNNGGRVGEAAKARVLAAVTALGYYPNHGARSLRSRRTRQIAYVIPPVQLRPDNYIMQQFLQALATASAHQNYSMVVAVPSGDPREEIRRLIASRSVDAFLLSELEPADPRVIMLAEAGMPFACFGRIGPSLPQHWVDVDNREAILTAVEHVLDRGFGRLAFLGYRSDSLWDTERVAGFEAGMARHGMARHGINAARADIILVDDASARRKIGSLLGPARPGARPDAIVTGSDRLAAVVYSVAADLRLRIGHDLAVTGFDGSIAAGLLHPRLTSVAIPVDDIARRVVTRALRQVEHGPDQRPGEVVAATLRLGESTGDPRRPPHRHRAAEGSAVRDQPGVALPTVRRVTIGDVAADAGVGVGTVSRVLNRSDQVRAATLRAVQDSIERLGYRPSHAAAALVRGTPRTVAVIVAHLTRPSTVVRVASALAALEERGYDTIVCNVDTPLERDRHLEALLPTHRADGVLAICLPFSPQQLGQFFRTGVALVTVDAPNPGVPQTIIDDVLGGRLATEHLIDLGHRRIGFVGDMPFGKPPAGLGFISSTRRLRGYTQALAAAGIEAEAGLIRRGTHDTGMAAEHAAQLLKAANPPSAIFAASDTQAIGVLAAADRLGVAVPGQLSVIGFDDIESAAFLRLSTVRQPLALSGTEGAQRLCALLRGERVYPLRQELPIGLVPRSSSAPYQAG